MAKFNYNPELIDTLCKSIVTETVRVVTLVKKLRQPSQMMDKIIGRTDFDDGNSNPCFWTANVEVSLLSMRSDGKTCTLLMIIAYHKYDDDHVQQLLNFGACISQVLLFDVLADKSRINNKLDDLMNQQEHLQVQLNVGCVQIKHIFTMDSDERINYTMYDCLEKRRRMSHTKDFDTSRKYFKRVRDREELLFARDKLAIIIGKFVSTLEDPRGPKEKQQSQVTSNKAINSRDSFAMQSVRQILDAESRNIQTQPFLFGNINHEQLKEFKNYREHCKVLKIHREVDNYLQDNFAQHLEALVFSYAVFDSNWNIKSKEYSKKSLAYAASIIKGQLISSAMLKEYDDEIRKTLDGFARSTDKLVNCIFEFKILYCKLMVKHNFIPSADFEKEVSIICRRITGSCGLPIIQLELLNSALTFWRLSFQLADEEIRTSELNLGYECIQQAPSLLRKKLDHLINERVYDEEDFENVLTAMVTAIFDFIRTKFNAIVFGEIEQQLKTSLEREGHVMRQKNKEIVSTINSIFGDAMRKTETHLEQLMKAKNYSLGVLKAELLDYFTCLIPRNMKHKIGNHMPQFEFMVNKHVKIYSDKPGQKSVSIGIQMENDVIRYCVDSNMTMTENCLTFGDDDVYLGKVTGKQSAIVPNFITLANTCSDYYTKAVGIPYQGVTFELTPLEVCTIIFSKIVQQISHQFGSDVENAFISVPLYFNSMQREAIIKAAEIAGIKLCTLITDMTAVAIASTHQMKTRHAIGNGAQTLVCRFEEQLIEISLFNVENNMYTMTTCYANHNINTNEWLRRQKDGSSWGWSQPKFFEVKTLLEEVFHQGKLKCEDVKCVSLIGNKSKCYGFDSWLQSYLTRRQIFCSDTLIVEGAAIAANSYNNSNYPVLHCELNAYCRRLEDEFGAEVIKLPKSVAFDYSTHLHNQYLATKNGKISLRLMEYSEPQQCLSSYEFKVNEETKNIRITINITDENLVIVSSQFRNDKQTLVTLKNRRNPPYITEEDVEIVKMKLQKIIDLKNKKARMEDERKRLLQLAQKMHQNAKSGIGVKPMLVDFYTEFFENAVTELSNKMIAISDIERNKDEIEKHIEKLNANKM